MDAKKPERITDPGKLGESIRSSIEALQKSGTYDKLLEETESEKGEISLYEKHIISYIENIIQNEKEMPIEEVDTQDQLVNIEALKSKNRVRD
jgi:hypothetical protein